MNKYIVNALVTTTLFNANSQLQATTTFLTDANSAAVAQWDIWTVEVSTLNTPTSQGAANFTSGSIDTSDVETTILDAYTPPGGFLGNPDTFYIHNGGYSWSTEINLTSNIDFVRISYALLGFGGSSPSGFEDPITLSTGETATSSGSYTSTEGGTVYYSDFTLNTASSSIEASFGDDINSFAFTAAGGSFRSIDSIQFEGFTTAPDIIPVPEPSTSALVLLSSLALLRRKRNK